MLVHGFGISFNIWQNLLPLLRPHFKLIMPELPGIGQSPMTLHGQDYLCASVDGLEELRRVLGFDSWDVLGYSTGSRIAEAYVQRYSRHVQRAVFLCPMALDIFKVMGLRFGFWMDGFLPAIGTWLLRGPRLKFFISLFGFNLKPDPHADEWYMQIDALPVRVLKETLKMLIRGEARTFTVPVPFSIIWGDEDIIPVTPSKRGPHDYFIHANHAAPVVAADEVAGAVLSILSQDS